MNHRPFRVDPRVLDLARGMRSEQTPAENKLWSCLRNRRLNGFKFRHQFPAGRYIVDFRCPACGLIVELDGPSHHEPDQIAHDKVRTEELVLLGHTIVRYTNGSVHENLPAVLMDLLDKCESLSNSPVRPSP